MNTEKNDKYLFSYQGSGSALVSMRIRIQGAKPMCTGIYEEPDPSQILPSKEVEFLQENYNLCRK